MNKSFKNLFDDFPFISFFVIIFCVVVLVVIENRSNTPNIASVTKEVLIAVLASYIFIFSINLQRPLVINDYLVIRRRESQTGNPVSISLLVGCPYSRLLGSIYDAKCTFVYHIEDGAGSNSAFTQTANREWIGHHYRFSFEIENENKNELIQRFWNDYLKNPNNSNTITVTITGSSNRLGGRFRYRKDYSMEHLIIGEDSFGVLEKGNNTTNDIKNGIPKNSFKELTNARVNSYWEEFKRCSKLKDSETDEIKEMIKRSIKEMNS